MQLLAHQLALDCALRGTAGCATSRIGRPTASPAPAAGSIWCDLYSRVRRHAAVCIPVAATEGTHLCIPVAATARHRRPGKCPPHGPARYPAEDHLRARIRARWLREGRRLAAHEVRLPPIAADSRALAACQLLLPAPGYNSPRAPQARVLNRKSLLPWLPATAPR